MKQRNKHRKLPQPRPPSHRTESTPPAALRRLRVDSWWMLAYRVLVVSMQAATILVSWQLWQTRVEPPMLPAFPMPQFDLALLLLASLVLFLVIPLIGLPVHACLLIIGMLQDQLRIQPQCISLALLMLGTISHPSAKFVARTHLVAIWFFAAFHKLISTRYYIHFVPAPLIPLLGEDPPWPLVFDTLRGGLALFEMSLALLAVIPRTRKWCAWQAAIFHFGVLQYLIFWLRWNESVWPWNIALVPAGFALIQTWKTTAWQDWRQSGWLPRAAVLLLVVSPWGYYVGMLDAYPAHCLYSLNTPVAAIMNPQGEVEQIMAIEELNIPFPPVPRLFEAYFHQVAEPGDVLIIRDFRRWARGRPQWKLVRGAAERRIVKGRD
jgi:hypothetical protein